MIRMLLPPVRLPLLLALLLATVAVAACGDDDDDDAVAATPAPTASPAATTAAAPAGGAVVEVSLTEFSLTPAVDAAAAAGGITFQVSNVGVVPHEFVVIRSDAAPDALPQAAGVVDESQVEVMGRIDQWPGEGETREATFSLTPGRYLLICNLVGHYQLGTTAAFTVE